ncbi:hypothetical protein ACVME8_008668 [Bradyrhizobium diazoefficiens]
MHSTRGRADTLLGLGLTTRTAGAGSLSLPQRLLLVSRQRQEKVADDPARAGLHLDRHRARPGPSLRTCPPPRSGGMPQGSVSGRGSTILVTYLSPFPTGDLECTDSIADERLGRRVPWVMCSSPICWPLPGFRYIRSMRPRRPGPSAFRKRYRSPPWIPLVSSGNCNLQVQMRPLPLSSKRAAHSCDLICCIFR